MTGPALAAAADADPAPLAVFKHFEVTITLLGGKVYLVPSNLESFLQHTEGMGMRY